MNEGNGPGYRAVLRAVRQFESDDAGLIHHVERHSAGLRVTLPAPDGDRELFDDRWGARGEGPATIDARQREDNGVERPADREADADGFVHQDYLLPLRR